MSAPSALHVVGSVAEEASGLSVTVPSLCRALTRAGVETALASVVRPLASGAPASPDGPLVERLAGVAAEAWPQDLANVPLASALRLSRALRRRVQDGARRLDVLHVHGLWQAPCLYPGLAVRRPGARARLVVSPRGMLAPAALRFSRARKRVFWRLVQARAIGAAACLHATSEAEAADIRALGLVAPVAVIPNGVDLPALPPDHGAGGGPRTVLSLGRLHPIKGLEALLQAWARLEGAHPDWRLRVVGPAEGGHDAHLRALAGALSLRRVTIEGPLHGADKRRALHEAELFVMPSLYESFGMAAAEALAAGVPVVATHGAPWGGLEAQGCGWWTPQGVEPLAEALAQAMAEPPASLTARGVRGRTWMARDFCWDAVGREMAAVYRWLAGDAPSPSCVRTA